MIPGTSNDKSARYRKSAWHFLCAALTICLVVSPLARAEEGAHATTFRSRLQALLAQVDVLESEQLKLLDEQKQTVEEIKQLKIWVNKRR